eukprot:TRINITY_DN26566_c0_g2_i1.p1 TRINITY_DN26566_c0_g2~~TRINITY_DN26566_c0_g2_i1.p1  ORF type:complete len:386 (+),score=52.86 TRINITY_DN26566_c0_g2_i1:289-1446(+)
MLTCLVHKALQMCGFLSRKSWKFDHLEFVYFMKTLLNDKQDLYCLLPDQQVVVVLLPMFVRVLCRIRPPNHRELNMHTGDLADVELNAAHAADEQNVKVVSDGGPKVFEFSAVLQSGSQGQVFQFCEDVISAATAGLDSCIIAYGQTGAGKTYSMFGPTLFGDAIGGADESLDGVVPRLSHRLFSSESVAGVSITMLELYMGRLGCLLRDDRDGNEVIVRYRKDSAPMLENATMMRCANAEDLVSLVKKGLEARSVRRTMMSACSSRSHVLVILNVTTFAGPDGELQTSRIVMVDLAGSERLSKTSLTGGALGEAAKINADLTSLRSVLDAFAKGARFVPFRDSKLTMILQGCLSKAFLICACSPASCNIDETISTLRFAERLQQ